MKISYIKLKNYSGIYTCMNAKEIEIDFKECKNKIILFNGPNGSGKTTILSCLHPFATNGSLDVRNDLPLVIEGKEGYKEIHIEDAGSVYIIKHFYSPNKTGSHSVKSYIEKDGIELNSNGNVTSFKSIILEELDIEIDYLKLVRLGANVTNFIDLKATERKSFMGKILDEVDIYLKFFKKVSNDMKELKSLLSHTIAKLEKLNVTNPEDLKKQLESVEDSRVDAQDKLTVLNQRKAVINHEMSKLPDPYELKSEFDDVSKENKKMRSLLDSKKFNASLAEEKNIDNLKEQEMKLKMNIEMESNKRTMMIIPTLNTRYSDLSMVDRQIELEDNQEQLNSIKFIIDDLSPKVETGNNIFKGFSPEYTSKDVESVIIILDGIQNILSMTYEFGQKPVKKVIKLLKKEESIPNFIDNKLAILTSNKLSTTSNYILDTLMKKFPIMYPSCGDSTCKIFQFWEAFYELAAKTPETEDIEDEEFYTYMNHAYINIKEVIRRFGDNKHLFLKMPLKVQEKLLLKNVFNTISECGLIYDRELLNDILLEIVEYELYISNSKKLEEAQKEYIRLKNSETKLQLKDRKETIEVEIQQLKNSLEESRNNEESSKSQLIDVQELLELSISIKHSLEEISKSNDRVLELQNMMIKYKELVDELKELNSEIRDVEFNIDTLTKQENDIRFRLKEHKTLTKELKNLQFKYDNTDLVRKSLSSKEGMPLLHIKVYLKNTKEITNELLDMVYDGNLQIHDFDIDADEFRIPYIVNGKKIKDVRYASQGERSFASICLSFALSFQSITRYNIMLLDEVDSMLDTSNRAKFINIIEKMSDIIESEQNFLITHNNMFDMYPVDIIQLGDLNNKPNKLANYIKIKMK